MLDHADDAHFLTAPDLCRSHFAGQERIFRKIFGIPAAEHTAVDVDARRIDAGIGLARLVVAPIPLFADGVSEFFHQIFVEGGGHYRLAAIMAGAEHGIFIQKVGKSRGAVAVLGGGQTDTFDRLRGITALIDEFFQLFNAAAIEQFFPSGIVIGDDRLRRRFGRAARQQVADGQRALHVEVGHRLAGKVVGIVRRFVQQFVQHVVRQGHFARRRRIRPGAFPVAAGKDGGELIIGIGIPFRAGVAVFHRILRNGVFGIADILVQAALEGLFRLVRVVRHAQDIVAALQLVPAEGIAVRIAVVVRCGIIRVKGQRDRLAFVRLQLARLGEAAQHLCRLFDAAFIVRRRAVQLHDLFAGDGTRIGDGDVDLDRAVFFYLARARLPYFPGELRIREPVAEGIDDVFGIPVFAVGQGARLVIAVTHIDALFVIDKVILAVGIFIGKCRARAGAEIDEGRVFGKVRRPGIDQPAGRRDFAV